MTQTNFWRGKKSAPPTTEKNGSIFEKFLFYLIFGCVLTSVIAVMMYLPTGASVHAQRIAEGKLLEDVYLPAYVRRYPYMLVKLREDADSLSLCFDPTTTLAVA